MNIKCLFILLNLGFAGRLLIFSQTLFNVQYQYDNLYRLTTETYSSGLVVQYTYDILGNRTTKITSGNPCAVPSSSFTYAANNLVVTFTNTTVNGTTYHWAFGNGQTSTMSNPSVTYATAGTYQVCLTATNGCGSQQFCQQVTVTNCIVPTAGFTSTTNFLSATFNNTSTGATSYLWNFGNGQTSTQANPSHTYASAGTYNVCLTSTNGCGSNQTCQQVTVANCSLPTAGFSQVSNNLQVTFSNTSTGATNYAWNFGNGQTSTLASPSVTYAAAGTYSVCLTATNGCGSQQYCQQVTVTSCVLPTPAFTQSATYLQVTFSNTSTGATSYAWNFGNGQTSTLASPSVTYAAAGTYNVCLTATNACGSQQFCQQVTVTACVLPTAAFTQTATYLQVAFSNTSTGATSYAWTFGNGQTSTLASPSVTYAAAGTYNVCLTATSSCGSTQYCNSLTVTSQCLASLDAGPDKFVCTGSSGVTIGTGAQSGYTYSWSPTIGLSNPSNAHTNVLPPSSTLYTLSASRQGCPSVSDQVQITTVTSSTSRLYVNKNVIGGNGTGDSWANAIQELGEALWIAQTNSCISEIWVTSRTHLPTRDPFGVASPSDPRRKTFYLRDGIALYGGFLGNESSLTQRNVPLNTTTLSGDLGVSGNTVDNAYFVVLSVKDSNTTLLDGFTITLANANPDLPLTVEGRTTLLGSGGGIYNMSSAPIIRNCVITDNDCVDYGGGVLNDESSSPQFNGCTFDGNYGAYGGGGLLNLASISKVQNCTFIRNSAQVGGGIVNSISGTTIENSSFIDNSASLFGGGVLNAYCSGTISNSCFVGNSSSSNGAGVYNEGAISGTPYSITNCTFFNNGSAAFPDGGGIFNPLGFLTEVSNCIFWNNSTSIDDNGTPINVSHSLVQGGYPGSNNMTTNPVFRNSADPDGADNLWRTLDDGLMLASCSPALDAGNQLVAPQADILGNPRFDIPNVGASLVDLGAYELQGSLFTAPVISGIPAFCPNGFTVLTASGSLNYLWSNGINAATIGVHIPGTYTVTATDAQGCTFSASQNVIAAQAPTAMISGANVICSGSPTALTASGGASYLWSNGATTPTIQVAISGTYTVTVTNSSNCSSTASHTLTSGSAPTPSIVGPSTICAGTSATLTASGGTTYLWSTGATTASITASVAGSYTVTVTGANGCSAISTRTVSTLPAPSVQISGPGTICSGSQSTLTASGGASYQWNTGATTNSISVSSAGAYVVTVTGANGCTASSNTSVVVAPLPAASILGNLSICQGNTTLLTASGGTTYAWSTGATTPSITTGSSGSHSVTVTDANGCTANTAQIVQVHALPAISISGNPSICNGGSTTLTASVAASYLWSTGASSPSISANLPGTYAVTVSDANGCSNTASTIVTLNAPPIAMINGASTICDGDNATLTASGGLSYQWSTVATSSSISVSNAGAYLVTVTGANGCTASSSLNLVVTPLPTASILGNLSICQGNTTLLTASGGTNYAWSTGATTPSITTGSPGSHSVTITDANGCTASTAQIVQVHALPAVSISGNQSICSGGSTTLTASVAVSYLWSTGALSASISPNSPGPYAVTVTDANGCNNTASTIVTLNSPPVAMVNGVSAICDGDNATLTASGGVSYQWSTGSGSPSISVNSASVYVVTVTDSNGCTSTASHTLAVNPLPVPAIIGASSMCIGAATLLSSSGGGIYTWSTGGNGANITVSSPGIYTVTVTNTWGCVASATHQVTALPTPTASILGTPNFCIGGSTTLTATGGLSYIWSTGASSAALSATTPGVYAVTVTDAGGCTDSSSVLVSENPTPVVTIVGNSTICDGESSTMTASANGVSVFSWSTGANTPSISTSAAGTYTVTVTDANGCLGTSTISVTVNPNPPTPTITSLGNTLASSNAPSYQWYFAGSAISGATGQFFQATQTGFYSVLVTVNGCSTMSQPFPHTFVVGLDDSLSIGVRIFPNPNQGAFTVEFDLPLLTHHRLRISNTLGQVLFESDIEAQTMKFPVKLGSVSDGVYYLELIDVELKKVSVFKLVVAK